MTSILHMFILDPPLKDEEDTVVLSIKLHTSGPWPSKNSGK